MKIEQDLCMYPLYSIARVQDQVRVPRDRSLFHFRELSVLGLVGYSEMLASLEDRAFVLEA